MINIVEVKDVNQIKETAILAQRIWNEHYTPIIGKEQVDYMLANFQSEQAIKNQINEGYRYFLTYYNDKAIGYFAILADVKDGSLFLSKFYVDKNFRGQGIGRRCIAYMENICRERGLNRIWLTVNKYNSSSIKAYEKFGFKKVEELVQDIGNGFVMDDYKMEKILE